MCFLTVIFMGKLKAGQHLLFHTENIYFILFENKAPSSYLAIMNVNYKESVRRLLVMYALVVSDQPWLQYFSNNILICQFDTLKPYLGKTC